MIVKVIILILSLINGCYMLLDGIHVILNGKYIGPEKPGPWADLFYKFEIDVFKLGPLFVLFGIGWIVFSIGHWTHQSWAYSFGLIMAIVTLWYIPIGTFISIIVFFLLFYFKSKFA